MTRLLKLLVAVTLAALPFSTAPAQAAAPSSGATIQDRKVPVDGAGVAFASSNEIGWKVWENFQTTTAALVTDENGIAPTCGIVHEVCTSTGAATSEFVTIYDSASASGLNAGAQSAGKALIPQLQVSASLMTCTPALDLQFNKGLVMSNSAADLSTYVYWRPCRGGRN